MKTASMADSNEPAQAIVPKKKYSIPKLINLSRHVSAPYDLAKFSFDAVRAGIVPSLGSLRQPASTTYDPPDTRPRGLSSESGTTMDGSIVMVDPPVVLVPTDPHPIFSHPIFPFREPINPPCGSLLQKDRGFARFLKKHSSPTHQRVTAGGRIVPMEKKPAQPHFVSNNNVNGNDKFVPTKQSNHNGNNNVRLQAMQKEFQMTSPESPYSAMAGPLPPTSVSMQNNHEVAYAMPPLIGQPMAYPEVFGANLLPEGMTPYPNTVYYPTSNAPMVMPWLTNTGPYAAAYPMTPMGFAPWQSPDALNAAVPPQATVLPDKSQLYAQATQEFEQLGRQLNDLDRVRAMRNYDPALAERRVVIVEKRAMAKHTMDTLRKELNENGLKVSPAQKQMPARGWNADAPPYIPKSVEKKDISPDPVTQQPVNTGATSTIPEANEDADPFISRPPPLSPSDEGRGPWCYGRKGNAPPELHRQQLEIDRRLQEIRRQLAAGEIKDDDSMDGDSYIVDATACSPNGSNSDLNTLKAPPEVVKDWAKHLDALRKPKGVVTHVLASDGQVHVVEGQALKRPATADMTEFEKKYWANVSTPKNNGEMSRQAKPEAARSKENSRTGSDGNDRRCNDALPDHIARIVFGKDPSTWPWNAPPEDPADSYRPWYPPVVSVPRDASATAESLGGMSANGPVYNQLPRHASVADGGGGMSSNRRVYSHVSRYASLADSFGGVSANGPVYNQVPRHASVADSFGGMSSTRPAYHEAPRHASAADSYRGMSSTNVAYHQERHRKSNEHAAAGFNHPNLADVHFRDSMNNKGYSSVAVQNVHAIPLPNNLDGAIDAAQRKLQQSVTSSGSKIKSPRIVHHTMSGGGGWHGPFRRNIREQTPKDQRSGTAYGYPGTFFD